MVLRVRQNVWAKHLFTFLGRVGVVGLIAPFIILDEDAFSIGYSRECTRGRDSHYNCCTPEFIYGARFEMAKQWLTLWALVAICECSVGFCGESPRPNVLFITVDDLRPELGCYGNSFIHTPNIDRFAKTGMRFERAYCQQAVCNPSRTSFMTGMRPDEIGVTGNHSHFRDQHPNVVTLPQHFKQHGYDSTAIGKIYHGVFPDGASKTKWDTMGDAASWSRPAVRFGPRYYYTEEGIASAKDAYKKTYATQDSADWTQKLVFGLASESPQVSDSTLYDGKVADAAVSRLTELAKLDQSFFLAVGFIKPHSPYIAPKKYFDLYQDTPLALNPEFPLGAPSYAGHNSGELRRYSDQPGRGVIAESKQQRIRQAYYACVSFIDAQIGRVLGALDAANLSQNTIVVLVGDHGYHLGEQGLWGKTTNFELDTRVPLIIRAPGVTTPGSSSGMLVELVDLFPTLAELAGLPLPQQLASTGLVSNLKDPSQESVGYALSQYPRGGGRMGYSLRNASHRLTQWVDRETGKLLERELYDYSEGLVEKQNIADLEPEIVASMLPTLLDEFAVRLVATTPMIQDDKQHGENVLRNKTGFETEQPGKFESLKTEVGVWTPLIGSTIVDNKHAKSGKHCLQLTGGENTSVTLEVGKHLDLSGDLRFWAERWTSRSPFAFRIEKKTEKGWSLIYNGDRKVRVGRAFLSEVKVPLNDAGITHLRFSVKSPPGTGILIDDLQIAPAELQVITSAEVVPLVLPALVGAKSSGIVKVKIETTGSRNPISLTDVDFAVRGRGGDIVSAGVFATAGNSRFRADVPFGESVSCVDEKEGSEQSKNRSELREVFSKNIKAHGGEELAEGANYFWVACTLSDHADISGVVGAKVFGLKFSNGQSRTLDDEFQTQRMGVSLRTGGDDDVHTYRIPGLATTPKGTLIGVYDVRHRSGGDLPGDIDVGMSRSTDGGNTWDDMKIIMDMGDDPRWNYDGIGDPAVLVDDQTGTIWVAATWSHGNRSWRGSGQGFEATETGQFMLVKSTDDGVTWSKPINITKQVKNHDWCFVLQGPGKGITMQDGTLVFAAQYQDPPGLRRLPHSTIIYSKDRGATWSVGTGAFDDTTEAQVIEVEPGVLMLNCRYNRQGVRVVMVTRDMGETWEKHVTSQRALVEPGACMASLVDVRAETGLEGKDWLLFSNPDSTAGRNHISIKASADRGLTWPKQYRLLLDEEQSGGYSCMSMIDKDTIGILYEGSQAHMTFQRIKLSEIVGPNDAKKKSNEDATGGSHASSVSRGTVSNASESVDRTLIHELGLPVVFGDHMVLQSGIELPIWGKAVPGSMIEVTLGDQRMNTVASEEGRWSVRCSPRESSFEPITLTVRSGAEKVQLTDILIGEVWLCAGQSNMEWTVAQSTNGIGAIDADALKGMRLLNLVGGARGSSGKYGTEQLERLQPLEYAKGRWERASTTGVSQFSAVAWFFAEALQRKLSVPVGVICPAVGGTPTEAWVSRDSLAEHPTLQSLVRGNWLDNPCLSDFCRKRGEENLLSAIQAGENIPGDNLGPNHSFKPGFMWQATIEPLIPYAIRGVAWYQGESNAETPAKSLEQASLLPLMIQEWREAWGQGDFPFLFVQLPALNRPAWPLFREVQRRVQQAVPNVSMAVTMDVGDPSNVHPRNKQPVGRRLAGLALGKTYSVQEESLYAGPMLSEVKREATAIVLKFEHAGVGLKSADGRPLRHFEIAGTDGKFFPALSMIVGRDRVQVESKQVRNPQAVRYGWIPFPEPEVNFCNSVGVPASPFSTLSDQELFDTVTAASAVGADVEKRPNVLLIVSEDNGPELGCYGDQHARTPNLDRLASDGVRFENAYVTQSVCSSSRSTLFTGLYPHQNGQLGLATHQFAMYRRWPTTYSILKKAGYRTGLLGKTHVNPASVVEDFVDFRRITSSNFSKKNLADYAEQSAAFMNASDQPFFLTVNYPDAHWPLQHQVEGRPSALSQPADVRPMPYVGFDNDRLRGHLVGFYNCMARLDECVGELLEALAESGKAENTLVIYIGDHGAQFARGKVFVTEGGLRIPMIVRWPNHAKPGLVSNQLVSTVDLLPTIVAAAGGRVPEGVPGKVLHGVLEGTNSSLRTHLFAERNCDSADLHFPQRSVRDARYKLIKTLLNDRPDPGAQKCLLNGASNFRGSPTHAELKTSDAKTQQVYDTWLNPPPIQLYDLRNDPNEFHNLADDSGHELIESNLIAVLNEWQERTDDRMRYPELLERVTEENDECKRAGRRSPVGGWQYGKYLGPDAVVQPSLPHAE